MTNREFALLTNEEKSERFVRILRTKTLDLLTKEQISEILDKIDVDNQYTIQIVSNQSRL